MTGGGFSSDARQSGGFSDHAVLVPGAAKAIGGDLVHIGFLAAHIRKDLQVVALTDQDLGMLPFV